MSLLKKLRRKNSEMSLLEKRVLTLKSKRINCVYQDFDEFIAQMKSDTKSVVTLSPVNYYALKNEYIEAHWFYTENYDECYVKFTSYKDDRVTGKSEIFKVESEILVRFFAKVGIIIKLSGDN